MIISPRVEISYLCPACGNYFYGSSVQSYNTLDSTVLSDGSTISIYRPFWLTRCPKCNEYFAKEHLFKLPKSLCVFPPDIDFSYSQVLKIEKDNLIGRLDGCFDDDEPKFKFIEKAIEKGLYFPVTVLKYKKNVLNIQLHRDLWWEYNRRRSEINDDIYNELCYKLINMMYRNSAEDRLTLAELYRNVGEFDKCNEMLDTIIKNNRLEPFIDRIREEAINKNKKTVTIIKGRW